MFGYTNKAYLLESWKTFNYNFYAHTAPLTIRKCKFFLSPSTFWCLPVSHNNNNIQQTQNDLSGIPLMILTATATPSTKQSLMLMLVINNLMCMMLLYECFHGMKQENFKLYPLPQMLSSITTDSPKGIFQNH